MFLEKLVQTTTNRTDYRLKRILADSCVASQMLFLSTDPAYLDPTTAVARHQGPLTDALTLAVKTKNPPLIEYVLFDVIQALWCILQYLLLNQIFLTSPTSFTP